MRSTWLLAQITALATVSDAFHPFIPAWMNAEHRARSVESPHTSSSGHGVTLPLVQRTGKISGSAPARARREAARLARKHGRDYSTLQRRKNDYDIMEPENDGKDVTEGIAQDGTDFSYFVKAKLGSKEKELWMLVDSASGTSWVMSPDCGTESCQLHDTFGAEDSETFKTKDKEFQVSYGTGEITGTLAHDTIGVAGVSFELELGIVTNASDHFLHYAFDGILGLSLGKGKTENFLDVMSKDGDLKDNIFSVALSRASDGVNQGEIAFGTINEQKFTGDLTYVDVVPKSDAWIVELGAMSYEGKKSGVGGVNAYIDTGSTFMYGPADLVEKMHSVIEGAEAIDKDGLAYKVPCDSKPLSFSFGGTDFEVSPKDWISPPNDDDECTSNLYGQDVASGALLLGATFVKNVYVVFDKDKERIGFAPLVQPQEKEETTTVKSSESTPAPTESSSSSSSTSSSEEPSSSFSTTASTSDQESSTSKVEKPSLGLAGPERPSSTASSHDDGESDNKDEDAEKEKDKEEKENNDEDNAAAVRLGCGTMGLGIIVTVMLLLAA